MASRCPVLFVGHGSPMNAIEDNAWSRAFGTLAGLLPRPRAVLAVSAHWFVPATLTTVNDRPETIHDFYGFPDELYAVEYPAPGDPALARRISALLGKDRAGSGAGAAPTEDWGLDHGTWSVLRHLFPAADVPVVQLSIHAGLAPADHLALGAALKPLRDDGVLVIGSGNLTHNLGHAMRAWSRGARATPAWATAFDEAAAAAIGRRDTGWLIDALNTREGKLAHPTPDHWLPALYAAGAADERDAVRFPVTGFDYTSLSMRAVLLG